MRADYYGPDARRKSEAVEDSGTGPVRGKIFCNRKVARPTVIGEPRIRHCVLSPCVRMRKTLIIYKTNSSQRRQTLHPSLTTPDMRLAGRVGLSQLPPVDYTRIPCSSPNGWRATRVPGPGGNFYGSTYAKVNFSLQEGRQMPRGSQASNDHKSIVVRSRIDQRWHISQLFEGVGPVLSLRMLTGMRSETPGMKTSIITYVA